MEGRARGIGQLLSSTAVGAGLIIIGGALADPVRAGDLLTAPAPQAYAPPFMPAAGDQTWTNAIWKQLQTNPFGDAYYGETIKTLVMIVMAGDYWNPAQH